MTFSSIKKQVIEEYDRRNLVSGQRYRALDKLDDILKTELPDLWSNISLFPDDKKFMKLIFAKFLNKELNCGEDSMINEIYNQINKAGISLTHYE